MTTHSLGALWIVSMGTLLGFTVSPLAHAQKIGGALAQQGGYPPASGAGGGVYGQGTQAPAGGYNSGSGSTGSYNPSSGSYNSGGGYNSGGSTSGGNSGGYNSGGNSGGGYNSSGQYGSGGQYDSGSAYNSGNAFNNRSGNQSGGRSQEFDPKLVAKFKNLKIGVKDQKLESQGPKGRPKGLMVTKDTPYMFTLETFRAATLVIPPKDFDAGFDFLDVYDNGNIVRMMGLIPKGQKPNEVLVKDAKDADGYRFAASDKHHALVLAEYSKPLPKDDLKFMSYFLGQDVVGKRYQKVKIKVNKKDFSGWHTTFIAPDRGVFGVLAVQLTPNYFLYRLGPSPEKMDKEFEKFVSDLTDLDYNANDVQIAEYLMKNPREDSVAMMQTVCKLQNVPREANVQVIALKQGSKTLPVQVDPRFKASHEEQVSIGFTEDPFYLLLSADDPTLWRVRLTPSAKVAGILLSGRGRQIMVDKLDRVPVYDVSAMGTKRDVNCGATAMKSAKDRMGAFKLGDLIEGMLARPIELIQMRKVKGVFEIGKLDAALPAFAAYDPQSFSVQK